MKNELKQFLMTHFNGRDNDYREVINLFEVEGDDVIIETEFLIDLEITDELEITILNEANDCQVRELIKLKLIEEGFPDNLEFNYVSGFYAEHIECLDIEKYLDNCTYNFQNNRYLSIRFEMEYEIDRADIETMMIGYKKCA